jgi:hypothetical protein
MCKTTGGRACVNETTLKEYRQAVMELLRGTAIENDEAELACLRKLGLHKQMEVGFVLRAAMLQAVTTPGNTTELAKVRSVDDALRFLYPVRTYARIA